MKSKNCKTSVIEAYFGQDATPPPAARSVPSGEKQPFLSSLLLERFRDFPIRRDFEFGTVNLLYGPNGTGKTSLLEAIELLYCGRNKRDPKGNEAYRIRASFADGATENATDHRPALLFRERNLLWYGQSEVKTNNLYQSFSQYNFLNTDAAVSLAESSDNLEEDLTKLLVGPETSKTWREIERTSEKLESKLKELDAIRNQVRLELASVNRRIEASAEDRPASNAVYLQLKEIVEAPAGRCPTATLKNRLDNSSRF